MSFLRLHHLVTQLNFSLLNISLNSFIIHVSINLLNRFRRHNSFDDCSNTFSREEWTLHNFLIILFYPKYFLALFTAIFSSLSIAVKGLFAIDCGFENIFGVDITEFAFSLSNFFAKGVIFWKDFDCVEKKDRMDFGGVRGFGLCDETDAKYLDGYKLSEFL